MGGEESDRERWNRDAVYLSTSFSIDPRAPWVAAHNAEARAVRAAFEAGRPVHPLSPFDARSNA